MEDRELIALFTHTFPFWSKLAPQEQQQLLQSSCQLSFKKSTNIHDGNECTGMILVKSGMLRVYLLSEEGKEITLYRLFAGDMCVLSASCVLNTITFDVFIDAEEDSDCSS